MFGYYVTDPERYGVVEFDKHGQAISIEEKPEQPKSHYAVTDSTSTTIKWSRLPNRSNHRIVAVSEITDVNNAYLKLGQLSVEQLSRGFAWLDTGTHDSLLDAAIFMRVLDKRQGQKVASPEETAFRMALLRQTNCENWRNRW